VAKTRKQRQAEREGDAKLYLLLLAAGLGLLFVPSLRLLGVLLFAAFSGFIYLEHYHGRRRKQALLDHGVEDLDGLSWEDFEELLLVMFQRNGHRARLTQNGADFGADLILEQSGERGVVQAKHWPGKDVGVKAVQEIVAAAPHYRATRTLVVTSGYFTKQAIELAKSNKVELWDRDRLLRQLATAPESASAPGPAVAVLASAAEAAPVPVGAIPSCPRCGSSMVRRRSKYGPFWGCSSFPDCGGTHPISP